MDTLRTIHAPEEQIGRCVDRFLATKARMLASRSRTFAKLTPQSVGLRLQDVPYAPRAEHFEAANKRLASIDRAVKHRLAEAGAAMRGRSHDDKLLALAMVERELDRARRAFGMFFDVFAQRGTAFGPALSAHDAIARDCYTAVRAADPTIFAGPLVPPLTYLEHGYSPATLRRGVTLSRLLGESNPFPLIRIPYDRDQPWQAVFLHEVAHNLQADLGLWVENKNAVMQRLAERHFAPLTVTVFARWHKEIFADLAALMLGGPASAWGMAEFLSHPHDKVTTYRPGGPHPTGYFRILILVSKCYGGWILKPRRAASHGSGPGSMICVEAIACRGFCWRNSKRAIPALVDEIAFQPRRSLAERTVSTLIPFRREDQAAIRRGGLLLAHGRAPADLPPRFIVSAARYAIESGANQAELNKLLLARLLPSQPASAVVTIQNAV